MKHDPGHSFCMLQTCLLLSADHERNCRQTSGHPTDTQQTSVDTQQTLQTLRTRQTPTDTQRTHGCHTADTLRTRQTHCDHDWHNRHCRQTADTQRTNSGHTTDKRQTQDGHHQTKINLKKLLFFKSFQVNYNYVYLSVIKSNPNLSLVVTAFTVPLYYCVPDHPHLCTRRTVTWSRHSVRCVWTMWLHHRVRKCVQMRWWSISQPTVWNIPSLSALMKMSVLYLLIYSLSIQFLQKFASLPEIFGPKVLAQIFFRVNIFLDQNIQFIGGNIVRIKTTDTQRTHDGQTTPCGHPADTCPLVLFAGLSAVSVLCPQCVRRKLKKTADIDRHVHRVPGVLMKHDLHLQRLISKLKLMVWAVMFFFIG